MGVTNGTGATMHGLKFQVKAYAQDVANRATKGVLILLIDDANVSGLYNYTKLKNVTESYEEENYKYIETAFSDYGVKSIYVASGHDDTDGIDGSYKDTLKLLNRVCVNGYLVCPQTKEVTTKEAIAAFINTQRNDEDYPIKAVLYDHAADSEGVVNFTGNDLKVKSTTTKDLVEVDASKYTVDVASYLCTLGANEGITNHTAKNVNECGIKDDPDNCVSQGELFLFNNGINIVFSRGVNSKTTIGSDESLALTKIRVIEVIDMVKYDVKTIFDEKYLGKLGNSYANRKTCVNTINTYLRTLTNEGYLSNDTNDMSYCEIDIQATKNYLESINVDTENMTDDQILRHKIGSHVFLKIVLKVADVIEDIVINLNYEI